MTKRSTTTRRDVLRGSAGAAIALGGAGGLLGACSPAEDASAGDDITFLTILPLTSLTFAPELLADAGGYFADQGLSVTFQTTRGSAQAIALVLAGGAPLTRVGQIEAVGHAANRDAPIVNIGTVIKNSTIRFVSSESNPLREPEDFVGKTVGIPSEGGSTETTLDLILSTAGIEPDRVERQVVGLGPAVFNLVEQGRIAGYAISIDTAKILEAQRPGVVVFRPGDFIASGAQFYMTSRATFAERRETLRKYLEAIRGAVELMIADDGFDETLAILRSKYSFSSLDDDMIAKSSLAEYVESYTSAGLENLMRTVPETWQRGYRELVGVGQAADGKDPSEWYTNELVASG